MNKNDSIITIDGPAGSGKSTVAKIIAERLNYAYLDTGAMYRALTWKIMKAGGNFEDSNKSLTGFTKNTKIYFKREENVNKVFINDIDVTRQIRTPEVTRNVRYIAACAEIRAWMVKEQQRLGEKGHIVAEGRDIGTVVFPGVKNKFFLEANIKERAKRRYKDLKAIKKTINIKKLEKEIRERDLSDINRVVGPLKVAEDAVVIDTTSLTIEEVVEKILDHISKN
jgi:cytidylate kinase